MRLKITSEALLLLKAEIRKAGCKECCGLLLGCGLLVTHARPVANVHPEPSHRFEIDPQALVDAHRAARVGGPEVIGYYHSHPSGPSEPSATDRAMTSGDGKVWAIVGVDGVTFWRDDGHRFAPLSYVVEDR